MGGWPTPASLANERSSLGGTGVPGAGVAISRLGSQGQRAGGWLRAMTQGRTRAREDKPGTCFALGWGSPGPFSPISHSGQMGPSGLCPDQGHFRPLARHGHGFPHSYPQPHPRGNQNCSFLLGPGSNSS